MTVKTYSIFGAGASGLYTAWRLLDGKPRAKDKAKQLRKGDVLELYDWGKYDFSKANPGTREPGARVCTWHYKNDPAQSFVELGGMRYVQWDTSAKDANGGKATGHRLVSTVISQLGLDQYAVPFNVSGNPLYFLRARNMYLSGITSANPAPYDVSNYGATASPDNGFGTIEQLAFPTQAKVPQTRGEWDDFYQNGRIDVDVPDASIYKKGDYFTDIAYWNLTYDQLGGEGFNYVADGNGYTSNVINWNSADALQANNEFTPGSQYATLTIGYSGMFTALFQAIVKLAKAKGVVFRYYPDTRLHSILAREENIVYTYATRENPNASSGSRTTNAAWLAMPRHSLELVAQATRYANNDGLDVLNAGKVQLYMDAAIQQPSYKVGMFFDSQWWLNATFPAPIIAYVVTADVIAALKQARFPPAWLKAMQQSPAIFNQSVEGTANFLALVEQTIGERPTVKQEQTLAAAAQRNSIGPSVTDTPIRQVVYFGDNARDSSQKIYGILASYDDEQFTSFWRELELGAEEQRKIPEASDTQPLQGPRIVPEAMEKMLRRQLAELHFGPSAAYSQVPPPLEARYMDWSLPPFNAGYHAWAAHFDIAEVQQNIRKPSQLIEGADANIFIVGEAYSNDQAWVEGAYCTAESVLNDYFGIEPIIDDTHYPFICKVTRRR